jgi:ATP-dependent Lhr-like helicase
MKMKMTNLCPLSSNSEASSSFALLHPKIQRWIWESGWTELKDVQERSISAILNEDRDILISAATASGKTEAAFLPILTNLINRTSDKGTVVYISPLKALINDQFGRLEQLCEALDIPIIPWHGDISSSHKSRFMKNPEGIVLITPESLESLLMRNGHLLTRILRGLRYIVVDELHAFVGSERGRQLQSLMHRIDAVLDREVPRIGLSATIGDMPLAAEYLRSGSKVLLVQSQDVGQELKVLIKGYIRDARSMQPDFPANSMLINQVGSDIIDPQKAIGEHLFRVLRGENHLVFPNSRDKVEYFADFLREKSQAGKVPNEFWPHHGNLSKAIREETEAALKRREIPATAICTTTLELGIDIGSVKSVVQIGVSPSVAALRQRLGRSGRRRGEPAILRSYIVEDEVKTTSAPSVLLREELILAIAQVRLLISRWYEPPRPGALHLSTLIQQLLSILSQYGGMRAKDAWNLLCSSGPFKNVSKEDFSEILMKLGKEQVLTQESGGLLLHGPKGEKISKHYSFYASFVYADEYRIICGARALGSVPFNRSIFPGSYVIFAGRRWLVTTIDQDKKIIEVSPDQAGSLPAFDGSGFIMVHDRVREEMREVLSSFTSEVFLDAIAEGLLHEAKINYKKMDLNVKKVVDQGSELFLFLWKGDWIQDTVALLLRTQGINATNDGICISVRNSSLRQIRDAVLQIEESMPSLEKILAGVGNVQQEKWDFLLPQGLVLRNYASHALDIPGSLSALREVAYLGS